MRIGSLFSGAGGLDMAVEAVFGGRTVWHSEIDKAASKVLAHRWPDVPNLGSITEIDWASVEPVNVLCGGFPCQDVSAAGKRAGIKAGTRSGLWSVFAEAIDVLRPRYVVIENVRGLLSATAHRDMESGDAVVGDGAGGPVLRAAGAVLGDLADLGYDAVWATVAAADVGAPHRRERVFIVASDAKRSGRGTGIGDPVGRRIEGREQAGAPDGLTTSTSSGIDWLRGEYAAAVEEGDYFTAEQLQADIDAHSSGNGWDEGRAEPARQQRGFDAALGGDGSAADALRSAVGFNTGAASGAETGAHSGDGFGDHRGERADVELLPTPCVVDRLATTDMTLEQWDESRKSQKERGVGWLERQAAVKERLNNGNGMGMPLAIAVQLLPTPQAHDAQGPKTPEQIATMRAKGAGVRNLNETAVHELLSTPQSRDYKGRPSDGFNNANLCRDVALLCTPAASDGAGGKTSRSGGRIDEPLLGGQAREMASAWGKYAPAIHRWEQLTRPAPAPTEPKKNGNPRLSAAFSEWLMGWPDGWVTDPAIGISRNDQLRIIGNGVCTQQAIAALRYLLAVC